MGMALSQAVLSHGPAAPLGASHVGVVLGDGKSLRGWLVEEQSGLGSLGGSGMFLSGAPHAYLLGVWRCARPPG